jgi:hypothetical protein
MALLLLEKYQFICGPSECKEDVRGSGVVRIVHYRYILKQSEAHAIEIAGKRRHMYNVPPTPPIDELGTISN